MSPANTVTAHALSAPTARSSAPRFGHEGGEARRGRTRPGRDQLGVDGGLAAVPGGDGALLSRGVGRQARGRDELRREQAGQPIFAAADAELFCVVRDAPADREVKFGEHLVERDQVAVPLCVGQHPVAVEHQGPGRRAASRAHQARPTLPKRRM